MNQNFDVSKFFVPIEGRKTDRQWIINEIKAKVAQYKKQLLNEKKGHLNYLTRNIQAAKQTAENKAKVQICFWAVQAWEGKFGPGSLVVLNGPRPNAYRLARIVNLSQDHGNQDNAKAIIECGLFRPRLERGGHRNQPPWNYYALVSFRNPPYQEFAKNHVDGFAKWQPSWFEVNLGQPTNDEMLQLLSLVKYKLPINVIRKLFGNFITGGRLREIEEMQKAKELADAEARNKLTENTP